MALVSMFLCNQSYASHGRDFLLGATILNFNALFCSHEQNVKVPCQAISFAVRIPTHLHLKIASIPHIDSAQMRTAP